MRSMTRQQIYDLIWERPVSKVAPELGLTVARLSNICRKHDIPMPVAGYWAKREWGKPVERQQLPAVSEDKGERVDFVETPVPPSVIAATKAPPPRTRVIHPAVQVTMRLARSAPLDRRGLALLANPDAFRMLASPALFERVGVVLAHFTAAATGKGVKFFDAGGVLAAHADGESIEVKIWEATRREPRPKATPHDREWDYVPSGNLQIQIGPHSHRGANKFADTRQRKLEERADEIVDAVMARAAAIKDERTEREAYDRRISIVEGRRMHAALAAQAEQSCVDYLNKKLGQQAERDGLIRLLSTLPEARSVGGEPVDRCIIWMTDRLAKLDRALSYESFRTATQKIAAFRLGEPE